MPVVASGSKTGNEPYRPVEEGAVYTGTAGLAQPFEDAAHSATCLTSLSC